MNFSSSTADHPQTLLPEDKKNCLRMLKTLSKDLLAKQSSEDEGPEDVKKGQSQNITFIQNSVTTSQILIKGLNKKSEGQNNLADIQLMKDALQLSPAKDQQNQSQVALDEMEKSQQEKIGNAVDQKQNSNKDQKQTTGLNSRNSDEVDKIVEKMIASDEHIENRQDELAKAQNEDIMHVQTISKQNDDTKIIKRKQKDQNEVSKGLKQNKLDVKSNSQTKYLTKNGKKKKKKKQLRTRNQNNKAVESKENSKVQQKKESKQNNLKTKKNKKKKKKRQRNVQSGQIFEDLGNLANQIQLSPKINKQAQLLASLMRYQLTNRLASQTKATEKLNSKQ